MGQAKQRAGEIHRTKERIKRTGEVFTPMPLVKEIMDKLPRDALKPGKTALEPACGDGNFLIAIIAYKVQYGSTIEQACMTTYGVDLMPDNVKRAKERMLHICDILSKQLDMPYNRDLVKFVLDKNIICANFLELDNNNLPFVSWKEIAVEPEMRFDTAVGNPPFSGVRV